ncbi:MAG: hypothetical protein ACK56F_12185 [bacterium]
MALATCTAAAQGTPRCAGASCPRAAAETAGRPRQVTFSLPPTMPPTTTSSSSASGRPLHNARPPNRLNLCACRRRVWGGPVMAHHLFLLCFPPRPSRDLLYLTHVVHMYILALACLY